MRICGQCKAAENPLSGLKFTGQGEGARCENCAPRLDSSVGQHISGLGAYTVIKCPDPNHGSETCKVCLGLGVVRVKTNAIPVYTLKKK